MPLSSGGRTDSHDLRVRAQRKEKYFAVVVGRSAGQPASPHLTAAPLTVPKTAVISSEICSAGAVVLSLEDTLRNAIGRSRTGHVFWRRFNSPVCKKRASRRRDGEKVALKRSEARRVRLDFPFQPVSRFCSKHFGFADFSIPRSIPLCRLTLSSDSSLLKLSETIFEFQFTYFNSTITGY